jgi:hypothetical protein
MAVKVIDKAAQQEIEVSAAEAQEGIATGRYGVRPGSIRVAKGLDTGTVDAEQILGSLSNGWRIVDDDEASQIQLKREEADATSQILGGIEAASAGASLGLSSMALEGLGADPERMRLRREALGGFAMPLEIAGGLAAIAGTGGGSLAAKGAVAAERGLAGRGLAALGAPTRAVEALGQTVERGVAGALGTGRMARVVAPTARGAVEGYFAGAGAQIDENVLGRREQTAESIFIDGRLADTLLGAGIGAGLPIAFEAARGAAQIPDAALRRVLGRSTGAPGGEAGELVAREVGRSKASLWDRETIAEQAGQLAERVAPFSSARPETYGRSVRTAIMDSQRINDLLSRRSEIEEGMADVFRDRLPKVQAAMDSARVASQGEAKLRRMDREFGEGAGPRRALYNTIAPARVRDSHAGVVRALDNAEQVNAQSGFRSYDVNALREIRALSQRLESEIGEDAISAFGAYDRFKRDLASVVNNTGGFSGRPKFGATSDIVEANKLARSMYTDARDMLENSAVWGKGATEIQKELNASWVARQNAVDAFSDEAKGTGLSRIFNGDGTLNMQQALRIVRQSNRAGGESVTSALDDVLEAQLEHLRVVRKHYELPEDAARQIGDVERDVAELRRVMAQQAKDAGDLADIMELRGAESGSSVSIGIGSNVATAAGALIGSAVGGPIGAVVGMGVGAALRPYTVVRTLASLLSMADRIGAMRGAATGGMFARIAGPAATKLKSAAGKLDGKTPILPISYATSQERKDRIDRVRHEVAMLATRPDLMRERMERSLQVVNDVAPGTAGEIGKVAQRAAMFLASKQPKTFSSPFSGRPPIVDPGAADRYLRYVEAVEHPIETLALLDSGRLTVEHAEAIQSVYPELWTSFREDLMEALGAAEQQGREVPYRDRLQLSVLVDLPTTLTPQQLLAVQAGNAATAAAEQVPQSSIRSSDKASKVAENAMTPAQRTASGIARA